MSDSVKMISANSLPLPVLGQGGWNIGDNSANADKESAAIRLGIELGMKLIDTAEMYGDGRSEEFIGNTLKEFRRDDYILTTKVYPHNAGRRNIFKSCDASLKRLRVDYIDLYLLHWRGIVPLAETVECMEELVKAGKIRRWGVSNFDTSDMEELWSIPDGSNCAVDQVLYNLGSRGIEYDLIPWLHEHNVPVMAYCPLAQGGTLKRMNKDFLTDSTLNSITRKYGISVMQLLLAFVLRQDNLIAIPKTSSPVHVAENAQTIDISVEDSDWSEIDKIFWPPSSKMHLDIE